MQRSKRRKINAESDSLKSQFLEAYIRRIAEEVFDENPNRTSIDKASVERAQQNIAKKFINDWVEKNLVSGE